jgi:hypothetical protein
MGLEISRLARNNADFQPLLQICGLNQTLIGDADALYDLTQLNDRLVLGLKGTMSEAELFPMRARLQGGLRHRKRNKKVAVHSCPSIPMNAGCAQKRGGTVGHVWSARGRARCGPLYACGVLT